MQNLVVSYFQNYLERKGVGVFLSQVFDMIRLGVAVKLSVERIRELIRVGNLPDAKKIKETLPAVTFSSLMDGCGRKADNIKVLNSLFCLDFDDKDNPEVVKRRGDLISDPHIVACFISPSGKGLKILFNIQAVNSKEDFTRPAFLSVQNYFLVKYNLHIDPQSRNPAGLCFLSYDPDIYVNYEALPFEWQNKEGVVGDSWSFFGKNRNHGVTTKEVQAFLDILGDIDISGKVDDYDSWLRVGLGLASEYGESGRELFHFISEKSKGYDQNECDKKYDNFLLTHNNQVSLGSVKKILGVKFKGNGKRPSGAVVMGASDFFNRFGFFSFKKGKSLYYPFNVNTYIKMASTHLSLYCTDRHGVFTLLHIKKSLVHILEDWEVIAILCTYIEENLPYDEFYVLEDEKEYKITKEGLLNSVDHWKSNILHEVNLRRLPRLCLAKNILYSTPTICYKFYRNGILKIDGKLGTKFFAPYSEYSERGLYVFAHELLPRDYVEGDFKVSEVYKFVWNISGSEERMAWCSVLLGYLSHPFFDVSLKNKAVIFSDAKSTGGQENGRTGKGLLGKIVMHQYEGANYRGIEKQIATIDGKNFRADNKFKYQNCTPNTRLILLEDITTKHSIQQHFNELLEGFSIECKNSRPFTVYAKLVLTTNYSVAVEGSSIADRVWEFCLLSYYSDKHSPVDDFGMPFFSNDWSKEQWANYDAFMHYCLLQYLQSYILHNGNIPQLQETLNMQKKMEDLLGLEFLEWAEERNFEENFRYYKKELYESYNNAYPRSKLSHRGFLDKLRKFKKYHPDFEEDITDPQTGEWKQEGKSNGRYIVFVRVKKAAQEEEMPF